MNGEWISLRAGGDHVGDGRRGDGRLENVDGWGEVGRFSKGDLRSESR